MENTFFASADCFRAWLEANHEKSNELLVGFYKVGSSKASLTYDEALCFGWIDGVRKLATRSLTRFASRRERHAATGAS